MTESREDAFEFAEEGGEFVAMNSICGGDKLVSYESDGQEVCIEYPVHLLNITRFGFLFILLQLFNKRGQLRTCVLSVRLNKLEYLFALHSQLFELVF